MSSYKEIVGLFILIVVCILVEILWGDYLITPLLIVLSILLYIGIWVICGIKQFKTLVNWLKQGAESDAKKKFSGIWLEIASYVERLLRQKEQENDHSLTQLNKLLDAIQVSPNGVLLLDEENKIEWCNEKAAQHFSLDAKRDLQQHITNLIRDPNFINYLEMGDYKQPLKLAYSNGDRKLSIQISSYDENKLLLLSNDITQIERVERMRRNFVADVSHEIRTPLTVLSGFIETMQSLPLDEVERHRYLGLMQQQSTRMQALIDDLLTLARLEDSPPPPQNEWILAESILQHTKDTIQELSAGKHQIDVTYPESIAISGIESELISAVSNIAINAVRYTKKGGEISITLQLVNNEAVFRIKDTGQGIAQEHINNLTQRFYRVDKSRSRETGGTGLGLSIVKHVLLRHGGRLAIDSIEGKGSTFSLFFPANRVKLINHDTIN